MKGTIFNAVAIILGAGLGTMLQMGIKDKYKEIILTGMGLSIVLTGLQMALKVENLLPVIIALSFGGAIGLYFDLDGKFIRGGQWITKKIGTRFGDVGMAMVNTSLVVCVGAMAIIGSITEGLTGDASILYAKGLMDGIIAIIFAANMGIGVALSAIPIFLYQGAMTLSATFIQSYVTDAMIANINGAGGLLIAVIGTNMMKLTDIKVANFLPALVLVVVLSLFM